MPLFSDIFLPGMIVYRAISKIALGETIFRLFYEIIKNRKIIYTNKKSLHVFIQITIYCKNNRDHLVWITLSEQKIKRLNFPNIPWGSSDVSIHTPNMIIENCNLSWKYNFIYNYYYFLISTLHHLKPQFLKMIG